MNEIQETVDKVVRFIEQNNYFHAPYLDFLGVYTLGESCGWLDKGDKVILLKAYDNSQEYFIINKLGGELRLKYLSQGIDKLILIPEKLKFYLGGLDD